MLVHGYKIWLSTLTAASLAGLMFSGATAVATPLPTDPALDAGQEYKQAIVGKAWVVADPALPEETLLAKLSVGEVVRILRPGKSWDRVEVVDTGRTTGWILKRLFGSVTQDEVDRALTIREQNTRTERAATARRDLQVALQEESRARIATAREIESQQAVQDLVRDAQQRVADAQATWKRVAAQVQQAQTRVSVTNEAPTEVNEPTAGPPGLPVLVRPVAPTAEAPSSTVPVIPETSPEPVVANPVVSVAPTAAPAAPPVDVLPQPGSVPSSARDEAISAKTSAKDNVQTSQIKNTPPPSPAPAADPVRTPSTPETSSASPSEVAGASLVTPPPAIIGRDLGRDKASVDRPVTMGAGGVTLGGALVAVVMLAGLGGFGGWWRRRQGSSDPSLDLRLRSLSTVPVGKEASVALIGAPGRTLMVGCSSTGVHLVSELPGDGHDVSALTDSLLADADPHPSLRQLFPDTSSQQGAVNAAPVSHEMQRLAAASKRALGGLA